MVGSGTSFWHLRKVDRHFMWSSSVSITNYDKKVTCLPNQEKTFFLGLPFCSYKSARDCAVNFGMV